MKLLYGKQVMSTVRKQCLVCIIDQV